MSSLEAVAPATITVVRPRTFDELRAQLRSTPPPHYYLAGGTDLLVQHKDGVVPTSTWIDITAMESLRGIELRGEHLRIGARAVHEEVRRSPLIHQYAAALAESVSVIGGPQVRWRGTIGGNIANASPAGDTVPALHTLDAQVEVMGADGLTRRLPVADLAVGPRKSVLQGGDLIIAVFIPAREGARGGFMRLGQRQSQAISKVSVAVTAVPRGGGGDGHGGFRTGFSYLRIACGAVAPTVMRATRAETVLLEEGMTPESVAKAMQAIREEVRPIDDVRSSAAYRREMAGVLLERVLARVMV